MAEGIEVCWECHKTIHRLVPKEKTLGREYNTLEKLKLHEGIGSYIRWKQLKLMKEVLYDTPRHTGYEI